MSDRHELLNSIEYSRLDDGWMIVLHIVLRNLSVVLDFLLGKEIFGVDLLQKGVAFVLLVREDALDRRCRPGLFLSGRRDALGSQHLRNRIR